MRPNPERKTEGIGSGSSRNAGKPGLSSRASVRRSGPPFRLARNRAKLAVSLALLTFAPGPSSPAAGEASVLRLATVAPNGSLWHEALKQMAADWGRATGGRFRVVFYPGGIQGDEPTILRKIRVGQLQAAALTATGLAEIDSSFHVFTVPMFFASDDEVRHVLDALRPLLEERLEAKGFVLLNWGHGGWAHVFSKRPVTDMKALKQMKLFTWAGEDRMVQWYKKNGFDPVPLALTDLLTALQTGMVEAFPSTPLAAVAFQWYKHAPYMLDLPLGALVGGTVVGRKAWEAIPEADRAKLREAAARIERSIWSEALRQDQEAVAVMKGRGLVVTSVAGTEREAEWRAAAEDLAATMRGGMVPADIYDLALRERNAFRKRASAGAGL